MSKYIPAIKVVDTRFGEEQISYRHEYNGSSSYDTFLEAYKKAVRMSSGSYYRERHEPVVLKEVQFKEVEE